MSTSIIVLFLLSNTYVVIPFIFELRILCHENFPIHKTIDFLNVLGHVRFVFIFIIFAIATTTFLCLSTCSIILLLERFFNDFFFLCLFPLCNFTWYFFTTLLICMKCFIFEISRSNLFFFFTFHFKDHFSSLNFTIRTILN